MKDTYTIHRTITQRSTYEGSATLYDTSQGRTAVPERQQAPTTSELLMDRVYKTGTDPHTTHEGSE